MIRQSCLCFGPQIIDGKEAMSESSSTTRMRGAEGLPIGFSRSSFTTFLPRPKRPVIDAPIISASGSPSHPLHIRADPLAVQPGAMTR